MIDQQNSDDNAERAHFDKIESLLLTLAERVRLTRKTAAMFREYMDHGEYGLALDEIGVGMFDGGRSPDEEQLAAFRLIAELMQQDAASTIADARRRAQYVD